MHSEGNKRLVLCCVKSARDARSRNLAQAHLRDSLCSSRCFRDVKRRSRATHGMTIFPPSSIPNQNGESTFSANINFSSEGIQQKRRFRVRFVSRTNERSDVAGRRARRDLCIYMMSDRPLGRARAAEEKKRQAEIRPRFLPPRRPRLFERET